MWVEYMDLDGSGLFRLWNASRTVPLLAFSLNLTPRSIIFFTAEPTSREWLSSTSMNSDFTPAPRKQNGFFLDKASSVYRRSQPRNKPWLMNRGGSPNSTNYRVWHTHLGLTLQALIIDRAEIRHSGKSLYPLFVHVSSASHRHGEGENNWESVQPDNTVRYPLVN